MAFKLIESAQTRWRAVNAPHLVARAVSGYAFPQPLIKVTIVA
jgi:putative transposase